MHHSHRIIQDQWDVLLGISILIAPLLWLIVGVFKKEKE